MRFFSVVNGKKIYCFDLVEFNSLIKNCVVDSVSVEVDDSNLIIVDLINKKLIHNDVVLFDGCDLDCGVVSKLFVRNSFVFGGDDSVVLRKYFFGLVFDCGVERFIVFDGNKFELVNKR